MSRKPMTDEHKRRIAIGKKEHKESYEKFKLKLGDSGYIIKRFDKWNFVVYHNGRIWEDLYFGDIPGAVSYILRKTEHHDLRELINKYDHFCRSVNESTKCYKEK
jgi:hypothetical protein